MIPEWTSHYVKPTIGEMPVAAQVEDIVKENGKENSIEELTAE